VTNQRDQRSPTCWRRLPLCSLEASPEEHRRASTDRRSSCWPNDHSRRSRRRQRDRVWQVLRRVFCHRTTHRICKFECVEENLCAADEPDTCDETKQSDFAQCSKKAKSVSTPTLTLSRLRRHWTLSRLRRHNSACVSRTTLTTTVQSFSCKRGAVRSRRRLTRLANSRHGAGA
jgi:hypothetical protein